MQEFPAKRGKKMRGSRGRGGRASQDFPDTQGRSSLVPRFNLGKDTLLGLAASQRRTLAFTRVLNLSTGATGGYQEAAFTINSGYHIDGSLDATGYDKYMAFYSKCFVVASRVLVRGVVIDNATTEGVVVGCTVSTNNTSFAALSPAIENGMADWEVVFNVPDRFVLNQSVDVKKFLHKPNVLDDPQLFCTASALPGQVVDAHFWAQATGTTGATIKLQTVIEVLIDCVFTDPIPFT